MVTVSRNTHNQILIFFRVLLCFNQRFLVNNIELDMMLSTTSRVLILGDWINYFSYAVFDGENLFLEDYIEGETQA